MFTIVFSCDVVVQSTVHMYKSARFTGREIILTFSFLLDFVAIEVDIEDEENERPVPTQRSNGDLLVLQLAIWWLLFVVVVLVIRSTPVLNFVQRISRKLTRTKIE